MALYLGSQRVDITEPNVRPWWALAKNPLFLYETTYQCTLADTNYSSKTPSSSLQSVTFPATTYTTSANANVTFDRYGEGYHNGTEFDFMTYDYYVLADYLISIAYTGNEATMGLTHTVKYTYSAIMVAYRNYTINNSIVTNGISNNNTISITYSGTGRLWYRTAGNALASASTTYGFYITPAVYTLSATNRTVPITYINFRTPTLYFRSSDTYHKLDSFSTVDATNTIFKMRQRLYKSEKTNSLWEIIINRLADIYNTNAFSTELI